MEQLSFFSIEKKNPKPHDPLKMFEAKAIENASGRIPVLAVGKTVR